MIAVLLGTHAQPFERAVRLARRIAGDEDLVVQHGHTPAPADRRANELFVEMFAYDELCGLVERSDLVICHGGVGSIFLALEAGRRPVVIPRLRRYDEHVDDHQLEIAERLQRDGLVVRWLPGAHPSALRAAAGAGPRRRVQRVLHEAVWAAAPLVAA